MAMTVVKLTVMVMEVTVVLTVMVVITFPVLSRALTHTAKHLSHGRGKDREDPVATPLLSRVHWRALTSTPAMRTKLLAVKLHVELLAMEPKLLMAMTVVMEVMPVAIPPARHD